MIKGLGVICAIALFSAGEVNAAPSTYELTVHGKTCRESVDQQLDCDYKLCESLHISIAGIGLPDTGVTFLKSEKPSTWLRFHFSEEWKGL